MQPTLDRYRKPVILAGVLLLAGLLYSTQDRSGQLARAVNGINDQVTELMARAQLLDREITERVIDLPEDGQTWSCVFVWPANREADPESRRLAALFASEPRLQSLLAQTKVHHYTPGDPLFQARYAGSMGGETPQFWLLKPDENPSEGTAVYAVAGAAIPRSGRQMADTIAAEITRLCPRPRPKPTPDPVPDPIVVTPPVIPNIEPPVEPVDDSLPLWVWILPVLAAGAGAINEWKRST